MTEEKACRLVEEFIDHTASSAEEEAGGRGVLLLPGLNMKTEGMRYFSDICAASGASVYTVPFSFRGRREEMISGWLESAAVGWGKLSSSCSRVILAGYSLGALVAIFLGSVLQKRNRVPAGLLLLAPPLKLTAGVRAMRPFVHLPGLLFPSLAPREIRSRMFTSSAAYRAFYDMKRLAGKALTDLEGVPVSVAAVLGDELVDSPAIGRFFAPLAQCVLILPRRRGAGPRHLFLSPGYAGENWPALREFIGSVCRDELNHFTKAGV